MKNFKVLSVYAILVLLLVFTTWSNINLNNKVSSQQVAISELSALQDSMLLDTTNYLNYSQEVINTRKQFDGIYLGFTNLDNFHSGVKTYINQQMGLNMALDSTLTRKFFPPQEPKEEIKK